MIYSPIRNKSEKLFDIYEYLIHPKNMIIVLFFTLSVWKVIRELSYNISIVYPLQLNFFATQFGEWAMA